MKTQKLVKAATPAIIAAAVILLSLRSPFGASLFAAYGCVVALGAIVALDYRFVGKGASGR